MVKDQVYIRSLTKPQKQILQDIAVDNNLNTGKTAVLFALEAYPDLLNEIARLNRIITYKQNKIERLQEKE